MQHARRCVPILCLAFVAINGGTHKHEYSMYRREFLQRTQNDKKRHTK